MKKTNLKKELTITRLFDAPRKLVWKAWTDTDMYRRWWGPKGFTLPVAKRDLRVGGEYLYCMRSPEGKDYWGKGVYREIIPEKKLVMTDSFADEQGNTVSSEHYGMSGFPMEMLISVAFEEKGSKTKLTLVHSGIEYISDKDRGDMQEGWTQSFEKLVELLAQESLSKKRAA
jgi:uncharacterized protein YndB with AHSA1/START domain